MQVAVERRSGSKVAITIMVEPAVIQQRMEQLYQKYARRVNIPGFRPGKAPRKIVEERLDRGAMMQDAVEDVIDITYKEALREQGLEPMERGEIEDLQTGDDMSLTYTVLVSIRPEVTLSDYKGIEIHYQATQVNDEQVDAEILRLRQRTSDFSEVADQGIEEGDYVTIDYAMKVGSEPYPEGDTTGYPLEVGSDTIFPELNEGLLGVKQGETTTISKSYPEEYANKDLAGKTAEFDITVQQVRRMVMPDVSDEWAQAITNNAIQTADDLRERIKQNLQEMAERMDRDYIREELVGKVIDGAEMEVPETLADEEYEHLMHELEHHRLAQERMSLEEYAEAAGRTVDDIRNEQRLLARDIVRRSLIMQEIARREDISVTEEDINALLMMEAYNRGERSMEKIQKDLKNLRKELEKSGRLDRLASRLFHEKVLSFLENNATIDIQGLPAKEEGTAPAAEEEAAADSAEESAG